MTVGIYKLIFKGTDKVYVGQSTNIEKRFSQHILSLRNSTANYKLLNAYDKYGLPILEILAECSIEELDICEDEAINIFDSVNNGLNIYKYSNQAPTYTGEYGYGNTKYSKDQLIKSFNLLIDRQDLSYNDISKFTGVPEASIGHIACLSQHSWLAKEYPERYEKLKQLVGRRNKQISVVSEKLSAKSQGIYYPKLISPGGAKYTVDNAYSFARQHGLAGNHLTEVLNGHRRSHKGWRVCPEEFQ